MSKPIKSKLKFTIGDKVYRQFKVSFNNSPSLVLVIDNHFCMDTEQSQNTFTNLCYEVCSTLKKNKTFLYTETRGMTAQEIQAMIKKIKPAAIVFGDVGPFSRCSLVKPKYFAFLREWLGIPTILTTPFYLWAAQDYYKKGEGNKALVGFNLKHMLTAASGRNPFEIDQSLVEVKPKIIYDIETFDKLMDSVEKKKLICIDIEGDNLKVIANKVFTVQIGFWHKGKILSYVIPWEHTRFFTWDAADLKHIKKRMRKMFLRYDLETVFHFGQFDIGQLCRELKMETFHNKVYDIPAGEFALDENWKFTQKLYKSGEWEDDGYKPYAMECVEPRYGIFRPSGMVIQKSDRANMKKFTIEEIAEYGGFDIVSPLLMREAQIQQATSKYSGHKSESAFLTLVHHQLGVMIKTFAFLRNTGIHINTKNARSLVAKGNVFTETAKMIRQKVLATPEGQKANKILLKEQGIQASGGLFSSKKAEILSLSKPSHLRTLFFDVAKLEPTKQGKTGENSTDKSFQNKHKEVPIVNLFSQSNKVKVLKSTFADGIIKIIDHDADFKLDGRLRPLLGFLYVLTGRLSSTEPNSQNIPTRSDESFEIHKELVKAIKASFSVALGRIMLGSDFSAHEVRMSGVISKDPGIRDAFLKANEAIRKFRLTPDKFVEAAAKVLALEGDIHIVNVRFFFKQDVDKDHPLRYKIKAIVFGVLYGKLAKGLAKELKIEESEAQSLIDVMFERWHYLKDWIDNKHEEAQQTFLVRYPNNRIAHMWAYLHDDIWAQRAMDRRSVNYPIQGFSSDIGVVSVYCYKQWVYDNITRKGFMLDAKHTNIVHDAQYSDVLYEHLPFAIYLTEHSMSTLPMNYYKDKFNYEINIPLSYGLEFGKDWASLKDWNFREEGYHYDKMDKKTKQIAKTYAPGLYDMIRDEGKRMDKDYDKVIQDARWLMKVRTKELETDPYTMRLTDQTMGKAFAGLHMFKEQEAV